MENNIVQILILFVIVGINYGCQKLIRSNPEMISGFHWGETDEEKENDRAWLILLSRCMRIANLITMIGGIISIIFRNSLLFILSLVLPVTIASIYAYCKRIGTKGQTIYKSKGVIIIFMIVVLLLFPVLYSCESDLEVSIMENGMEISGMYGEKLMWQDLSEASLCNALPSISLKKNGFSLGVVKLGCFKTTDGQSIKLFVHSGENYIRLVKNHKKIYYLSYRNKEATDKLFADIQQKMSRSN